MDSYTLKMINICDDRGYSKAQAEVFLIQMGVTSHHINNYIKTLSE